MRILSIILDYVECEGEHAECFVSLSIAPIITVSRDDLTEIGIPSSNYGFALGRIEEIMERKGLSHTKTEEEVKVGGKIVATTKKYMFEYGRAAEVYRAIQQVVDRCHASKGWDKSSRLLLVNYVSFANIADD